METTVEFFMNQMKLRVKVLQAILKEDVYNNVVEKGLYMSELKDTKEFIEELEKRGY
jgi:hypothetical protein